MSTLNRKSAPPVREIAGLALPRPALTQLDNGIPVYVLDYPGHEILKIEAVVRAGRPQESAINPGVARATARLAREGTRQRTGAELAEHLDFYGASLNIPVNLDASNFLLFGLRKYAAEVLPTFAEVLLEPVFPDTELDTFRRTSIQELQVELEKVEVRAYRLLTELIFGTAHPYGYNSTTATYEALTRDRLLDFHRSWYGPANTLLFASGRVDAPVLELLNRHLGQHKHRVSKPDFQNDVFTDAPQRIHLPHPGSLQTAIKIGRRLFARNHPDYDGMFVLNTLLGGYFGSRLMANIREKRGYTYNIYSTADAMLHDGCFYIATEVTHDKVKPTLKQIFAEMKRLREQPVDEEELGMVRNYLLGMLLNGLDGPLNTSDMVKTLVAENLPWDAFDRLVATIRAITPADLQALAERYLQEKDFWVVMVGG